MTGITKDASKEASTAFICVAIQAPPSLHTTLVQPCCCPARASATACKLWCAVAECVHTTADTAGLRVSLSSA